MLKIEIRKENDLFSDDSINVFFDNEFLPRTTGRGFFVAKNIEAAKIGLQYTAKQQTEKMLLSLVNERRFVYTQYWHPKTSDEIRIQTRYVEALNKIQRVAESLKTKTFKDAQGIIINLCNNELKMITPGINKAKHESIKNRVSAIKDFYAIKAAKIEAMTAENLTVNVI